MKKTKKCSRKVYKQLESDFKKEAIKWIKKYKWKEKDIDLKDIDFDDSKSWRGSAPSRLKEFKKKVSNGLKKSIILLKSKGHTKYRVLDGHSRILAAKALKLDEFPAFIVKIDDKGDIEEALKMHLSQKNNEEKEK